MDLEEFQVRIIALFALQFVYWNALYFLPSFVKDEKYILAAFGVTLLVSMTTAVVLLVRPYGK